MKKVFTLFVLFCSIFSAQAQGIITTVAGNGGFGGYSGDGGPATAAQLANPYSVAVDGSGNLYFADYSNNRIRKVNLSTGIITTVAGIGTPGYSGDGGPATAAQLANPTGVAVDGSNLYFTELGNDIVRKVNLSTGIITTVAGTRTGGYFGDGGPATSAMLILPNDVAVDGSGNLYIADLLTNRIRKVNLSTGIITTIAGTSVPGYSGDGGPATAAMLNQPYNVAVDGSGSLYIADGSRVRKVNLSTGIITTVAGNGTQGYSGDGGPATAAMLNSPQGVAVDGSGNLYIADGSNNRVRKVNLSTGIISTVAGNGTRGYAGDGGLATAAMLNYPRGVAVDNSGNLYIADANNHRIRKVSSTTITTPTITTSDLSTTQYCQAATLSVPFTTTGTFNSGNTFTAQLSDASGSFASPVNIGTLSSTTSGSISAAMIPASQASGTGYRIRVIGSDPSTTGSDNGANFSINALPALTSTLMPAAVGCTAPFSYTPTSSVASTTFIWSRAAVSGISNAAANGTGSISEMLTNITSAPINVTYVYSLSSNGCGSLSGYKVVVTVNPCTGAGDCTPPTFANDSSIVVEASCGNSDGKLSIIPASGVAPFMYSINGGTTYVAGPNSGYTFANVAAGTYRLRLKDAKACESEIVEREIKAVNCPSCTPPTFKNDGTIVLDATCGMSDGNISILPTSGAAPFMYSIDGGTTYVSGADAGYTFMNLAAGTYKLRLKAANGCESEVVERTVRSYYGTPNFVNNGLIVGDATCGMNDGRISILPTCGAPPFMYSIDGGATYVTGPDAGYTFMNLAAGTYKLRLKDYYGKESAIVERAVRSYYGTPTFVNNGLIVGDATCGMNDGKISILPTCGAPPFMYSIDGGTTYISGPDAGYTFMNLAAGTYRLRLKDTYGHESAIVERMVKNYYNCPGSMVSKTNVSNAPIAAETEVIELSPNPSRGQFKIQLKNFMSQKAEASIFNGEGKLVQKRQLNLTGNNTIDFDLTGKAPGMYYIKITSNNGTRTSKVLVQ